MAVAARRPQHAHRLHQQRPAQGDRRRRHVPGAGARVHVQVRRRADVRARNRTSRSPPPCARAGNVIVLADAVDAGLDDGELTQQRVDRAAVSARARDRGAAGRHAAVSRARRVGGRLRTQLHRARRGRAGAPLCAVHAPGRSRYMPLARRRRGARSAAAIGPRTCGSKGDAIAIRDRPIPLVPVTVADVKDPSKTPPAADDADQLPRAGAGERTIGRIHPTKRRWS